MPHGGDKSGEEGGGEEGKRGGDESTVKQRV